MDVINQICHRCREMKSLTSFYKQTKSKTGHGRECKVCNYTRCRGRKVSSIKARKDHLKRTYGITLEQELKMFTEQQGQCAICTKHQDTLKYRLHVDHDHITNRIRGLLCFNCNQMLGNARDSLMVLEAAIAYIKKV